MQSAGKVEKLSLNCEVLFVSRCEHTLKITFRCFKVHMRVDTFRNQPEKVLSAINDYVMLLLQNKQFREEIDKA